MLRIIDIELPSLHHSTSLPPGKKSYYFILSLVPNVKTDDGISQEQHQILLFLPAAQ